MLWKREGIEDFEVLMGIIINCLLLELRVDKEVSKGGYECNGGNRGISRLKVVMGWL